MADTNGISPLWRARQKEGLSREHVSRLLDPPISAKTLERWEKGAKVPPWRLKQLAHVYRLRVRELEAEAVA